MRAILVPAADRQQAGSYKTAAGSVVAQNWKYFVKFYPLSGVRGLNIVAPVMPGPSGG